ncbi:MAG TPA: hypothetical protein VGG33_11595, partial [Polyangia bacterium]
MSAQNESTKVDLEQPSRGAAESGGMSFPRQVIAGRCYLVTRRCTQRQFLLRPDDETNNAFLYCLAYAAQEIAVDVVAFVASSNHYHAVVVDPNGVIPRFLELFHKLIAKHQNALRRRRENMWSSEQTSLVELAGPDDVLAKVVYTLANPVKDHLVERAHHWPGATSLAATVGGRTLRARRPIRFFRKQGAMPAHVQLRCTRMPGFEQIAGSEYRRLLEDAIAGVESAAAAERATSGQRLLGRKAVLALAPEGRPTSVKSVSAIKPQLAARNAT